MVAVQNLDSNPINSAKALMISLRARSIPSTDNSNFRSEPVTGHLTIRAKEGLKFYRRHGDIQIEIPASYADGRYRIELQLDLDTYWLVIKQPRAENSTRSGSSSPFLLQRVAFLCRARRSRPRRPCGRRGLFCNRRLGLKHYVAL